MLYDGHQVIADTFWRDGPNRGQTLLEKPLYRDTFIGDICYSGHFCEHHVNILGKTYLLIADTLWLVGKKKICMFLIDTFLYFNMKLII